MIVAMGMDGSRNRGMARVLAAPIELLLYTPTDPGLIVPMPKKFTRGQEVRFVRPQDGADEDVATLTLRTAKRIWAQSEDGPEEGDGWLFFCQLPDGRPRQGIPGRARDFEPVLRHSGW